MIPENFKNICMYSWWEKYLGFRQILEKFDTIKNISDKQYEKYFRLSMRNILGQKRFVRGPPASCVRTGALFKLVKILKILLSFTPQILSGIWFFYMNII